MNLQQLLLNSNQLSENIPDLEPPFHASLDLRDNCFAFYPNSEVDRMIRKLHQSGLPVSYEPQNKDCVVGPGLQQQVSPVEYQALVDLYSNTDGQSWGNNYGWLDPMAAYWHGVTVSDFEFDPGTGQVLKLGTVTELNLNANLLNGSLPVSLGDLPNLENLDLGRNYAVPDLPVLNGTIPESLGRLEKLQNLNLSNNDFRGSIPASLGNLPNLQSLNLAQNHLTGVIPDSLGDLAELTDLNLAQHQLTGRIPSGLFDLHQLEELGLAFNQLTGPIPAALANLTRLKSLGLQGNQLDGPIPAELGDLINLEVVDLSYNEFSGNIPESIGHLIKLSYLDLSSNSLDGTLPTTFGGLKQLGLLELGYNSLTGTLPASLAQLNNLSWFGLRNNQLTGSVPSDFAKLHLYLLDLSGNRLSGSIPDTFGQVDFLYLSRNRLNGSIPEMWNAWQVDLSYNCFDISPGSQFMAVIQMLEQERVVFQSFNYTPQNSDCGSISVGDLNNDGCVDRTDLTLLMAKVQARSNDLTFDLNGDGKVDVADARYLVLHFTHPDGSSCVP